MKIIITIEITLLSMIATMTKAAIGQWNAYMAYGDITDIEPAGSMIYVLSSGSLFSYNVNDQSISTYNKVYPLNDTDISYIAWCNSAKKLVVIYSNQNIDLLDNNGNVTNISDYYNKLMTDDKTVNNITISGYYAYLSTGFGILKINVKDSEISDTYNLGMDITDCAVESNTIYAKTSSGIYAGNTSDNLLDKSNWNKTSASVSFNDDNDITTSTDNGYKEYIAYDSYNKCYWSNQSDGKLQGYKLDNDNIKTVIAKDINPDGPKYNYFWFMKYANNQLYTCGGGYEDVLETRRPGTIQILQDNEWIIYEDYLENKTGIEYLDINSLDYDPKDINHVFAGGRTGLYEFQDGKFIKQYNNENSPIESAVTDNSKNYDIVDGIKFDDEGNLWILNSRAETQSILKLADSKWTSFNKSELMKYTDNRSLSTMQKTMFDSRGLMWFVNNSYFIPSFYCYQPSTDVINSYTKFINEDGITITPNGIRCIVEDNEGNMWIGTDVGPIMLDSEDIETAPDNILFNQIKIPRNDGTNLADYLLSGVDIKCIAIDGGGRKWFGTNGAGIYLISEDNMTQIEHFTKENSPLLSNNIESMVMNNSTGEIFFGTEKGLCSYMSDATEPNEKMNKDNVYAYPNPVRPNYTGLITVTGLSYNADVKIVTVNGTLVIQGRSNGGTFVWDGNDTNGKRVASGIYMVETATEKGNSGTVCKIAIVN